MNFDVFGPFEITRHGPKKLIFRQSFKDLFKFLKSSNADLVSACGCYVFGIRAGRGYTPYYVGQAARTPIVKEAFNPTNTEKYNQVLSNSAGMPIIFFLPMLTPTGRYRKRKISGNLKSVDFLERWLIAKCLEKNRDLLNNRETRFLRGLHVTGILNATRGESTAASQELSRAIE